MDILTLRGCSLDRVRNAIYVVGPGTTLSVLAVVGLSVFPVSVQGVGSRTPALVLDGEDDHSPFSRNLEALGDGVSSGTVVTSDSWVGTVDLRDCTVAGVLPASEMGVA